MIVKDFVEQIKTQPVIRGYRTTYNFDHYADRGAPKSIVKVADDSYLDSRLVNKLHMFPPEAVVDVVYLRSTEDFEPYPFRRILQISWDRGEYSFKLLPKEATTIIEKPPLPIPKKSLTWLMRASSDRRYEYLQVHAVDSGYCVLDGTRVHLWGTDEMSSIRASFMRDGEQWETSNVPIKDLITDEIKALFKSAPCFTVKKKHLVKSYTYAFYTGPNGARINSDIGFTEISDDFFSVSSFEVDAKFLKAAILGKSAEVSYIVTDTGYSLIKVRSDAEHVAYIAPWES